MIGATHALLRSRRPDELTTQDIADEAQADPRLITYYFGTKAKLLEAVAADALAEFRAAVSAPQSGRPVAEQLRHRVRTYLSFARENPYVVQLVSDHLIGSDDPERVASAVGSLAMSAREFQAIIAEGVETGEMWAAEPRFVQLAVIAMSQFPHASPGLFAAVAGEERSEELLDAWADFIVALILGGTVGAASRPALISASLTR